MERSGKGIGCLNSAKKKEALYRLPINSSGGIGCLLVSYYMWTVPDCRHIFIKVCKASSPPVLYRLPFIYLCYILKLTFYFIDY